MRTRGPRRNVAAPPSPCVPPYPHPHPPPVDLAIRLLPHPARRLLVFRLRNDADIPRHVLSRRPLCPSCSRSIESDEEFVLNDFAACCVRSAEVYSQTMAGRVAACFCPFARSDRGAIAVAASRCDRRRSVAVRSPSQRRGLPRRAHSSLFVICRRRERASSSNRAGVRVSSKYMCFGYGRISVCVCR